MAQPRDFYTSISGQQNELQNWALHNLSSDPSTPVSGQFWLNTTTGEFKFYDGTSVIVLANSSDIAGGIKFKGGYNATTNTPLLDDTGTYTGTVAIAGTTAVVGTTTSFTTELTAGNVIVVNGEARVIDSITDNTNLVVTVAFTGTASGQSYYSTIPVEQGDMYYVTVAGTFFIEAVQVGDSLIAKVANPVSLADWLILEGNTQPASETVAGYIRIATQAEVTAGTNDTAAVTPLKLATELLGYAETYLQTGITAFNANGSQSTVITHNLNTRPVHVVVMDESNNELIDLDVAFTSVNTITLSKSGTAIANVSIRITG